MRRINLTFFKGGGPTEQVRKRDPEPQELTDLRSQINRMLAPLMGGSKQPGWDETDFGRGYNDTSKRKDQALNYYDQTSKALSDKSIAGVKDFDYLSDTMRDVSSTGVIPQAITDNLNESINRSLNKSIGSSLNNFGNRGIINSSVTNQSMGALSDSASDAYAKNYLSAYDSILNGLGSTINANKGVYDSEISGLNTATNTFLETPTKLWQGLQQQFNPSYTFWKDWQNSYDSTEDYDTIVHQGK